MIWIDPLRLAAPGGGGTPTWTIAPDQVVYFNTADFGSPSPNGQLTIYVRGAITLPATTARLGQVGGGPINDWEILASGIKRYNLRDFSGNQLLSNVAGSQTVTTDTMADHLFSYDLAADWARAWLDGTLDLENVALGAVTATLPPARGERLFAGTTGLTRLTGTFETVKVWLTATSDGTLPGGTPFFEVNTVSEANAANLGAGTVT